MEKMSKKSIAEELESFIEIWDYKEMIAFFKDVYPLIALFEVDEENDWVEKEVGKENVQNVRVVRMAYILSRIAEFHTGKFCKVKVEHKNLWKRLEQVNG